MTTIQSAMLAICFGAVIGTFIGNVVILIQFAITDRREKKRKEKQASAQNED